MCSLVGCGFDAVPCCTVAGALPSVWAQQEGAGTLLGPAAPARCRAHLRQRAVMRAVVLLQASEQCLLVRLLPPPACCSGWNCTTQPAMKNGAVICSATQTVVPWSVLPAQVRRSTLLHLAGWLLQSHHHRENSCTIRGSIVQPSRRCAAACPAAGAPPYSLPWLR